MLFKDLLCAGCRSCADAGDMVLLGERALSPFRLE